MPRHPLQLALSLAILAGIIAALFPVVPVIERTSVVQTQMRRVDHQRRADFVGGQYAGESVLLGDEDSPVLTLTSTGAGTYTSPVLELGLAATSIGANWIQNRADGATISIALHTSRDGSTWTPWREIEPEGRVTTAGQTKLFSELAPAEGARYAQYRVTLSATRSEMPEVSAVRLYALDSATLPPRSEVHVSLAPRDSALATIKPLGIVSRKEWGADESLRFKVDPSGQRENLWPEDIEKVEKIVVHHTAGPNVCSSTDLYCQRRSVVAINDIYYYHAVTLGWGDIGYNSLVGYDGRIYEGRAGPGPVDGDEPLSEPVVAGHALKYNKGTHGIALMGDFQNEPVPDLQYEALAKMVGWIVKSKLAASGAIDPLAFSDFTPTSGETHTALPNIIGHRDVNDTECPGDYLYERLVDLRYRAERLVEWPPVHVELRARPEGDTIAYHILVDNHEPDLIRRMSIKGAVPENAEYVDSWAGSPNRNRGMFDGSVVTWVDPDAELTPGRDRREYVFIVRPRPGVSRGDVQTAAWVEFAEPTPGVAMSDRVSADQPVEAIADLVAGGRTFWSGDWPVSRNVGGYYGSAYQYHEPGDGSGKYTWEVELPEPGSYEVFAWWTQAIDRATNAPYTIHARDGDHAVRVNQRKQGARWVSLGTYAFDAGPARVTLSDDADGVAIADGVRLRKTQ